MKIDGQGGSPGVYSASASRWPSPARARGRSTAPALAIMKSVMGPERILLNCGGQYLQLRLLRRHPHRRRRGAGLAGHAAGHPGHDELALHEPPLLLDRSRRGLRPPAADARPGPAVGHAGGHHRATADGQRRHAQAPAGARGTAAAVCTPWPTSGRWTFTRCPASRGSSICGSPRRRPANGTSWPCSTGIRQQNASVRLDPQGTGLAAGPYVFYDVWEKKLLDGGAGGLTVGLAPMSCKLIAARPAADHPQLVGTSRHITQGADDLLEAAWDPAAATWSGRSRVVGGDPYELRFTLPPGWTVADGRREDRGPAGRPDARQRREPGVALADRLPPRQRPPGRRRIVPAAKVAAARLRRGRSRGRTTGRWPIASIATASCWARRPARALPITCAAAA